MAIDCEILTDKLKHRAIEVLNGRSPVSHINLTESEIIKMFHELEVCHLALEMVQEELARANDKIDEITRKYDDMSELHNRFVLQMMKERSESFESKDRKIREVKLTG